MPVRPSLLHRMALVSFLRFRKNLGNLREFFGQMVYRPPGKKIARTPMLVPYATLISKIAHVTIPSALHGHVTFPIFSEATVQTARG